MRHLIHPVATLAALALSLACNGDDPAGPVPSDGPEGPVATFVSEMNAHRESVGCAALEWHSATAEVAFGHSQDMQDRAFFSHTNPDGASPWDRLEAGGVTWNGPAGENIAMASGGGEAVLNLWLGSPGHRANIENCALREHGVGLVGSHWTHLFTTAP